MQYLSIGGANEVGASCHILLSNNFAYIIDCGQRQSDTKNPLPDMAFLQEILGNRQVAAILITHSHFDHIGALPLFCQAYPNVPVYATPSTCDLTKVLLYDSLKVMDLREAEVPLYDEQQVKYALDQMRPIPFNSYALLPEGIKAFFYPAGHILGAAMIGLDTFDGRFLFTGDFSISGTRTISGATVPDFKPHVIITESTYGNRHHADRKREEQGLVNIVADTIANGGHVLIPSFAQGRGQEILFLLRLARNQYWNDKKKFPVWVDGLVRLVNTVYSNYSSYLAKPLQKRINDGRHPFYSDTFQPIGIPAREHRERAIAGPPACFVASSGMLTGGASAYYAEKFISNPKNAILITGYQDEESPGRKILDLTVLPEQERKITLSGVEMPVRCQIRQYHLSAHADQLQIIALLSALKPKKVILTHGDKEARDSLTHALTNRFAVISPSNGEMIDMVYTTSLAAKGSAKDIVTEADIFALWQKINQNVRRDGFTIDELSDLTGASADKLLPAIKKSELFKISSNDFLFTPFSHDELHAKTERKKFLSAWAELVGYLIIFKKDDSFRIGRCISVETEGIVVEEPGLPETSSIMAEYIVARVSKVPDHYANNWFNCFLGNNCNESWVIQAIAEWNNITSNLPLSFSHMEQNLTRSIFMEKLGDSVYKVGMDIQQNKILLSFHFPLAIPEQTHNMLTHLAHLTGWTYEINPETNQASVRQALLDLLPEGSSFSKEPSIHRESKVIDAKINIDKELARSVDTIRKMFSERTGWSVNLSLSNDIASFKSGSVGVGKSDSLMEINQAYQFIKTSLQTEGIAVYKLSLMSTSEPTIRLQFASPDVANRCLKQLAHLSEVTGYLLTVHSEPNNQVLFQMVRDILPLTKEPSLHKELKEIRVHTKAPVTEAVLDKLRLFTAETGFRVIVKS